MPQPDAISWVQLGAVGVLVLVVFVFMRDFRRELAPILKETVVAIGKMHEVMVALLERERVRGERLAARDAQLLGQVRQPAPPAMPNWEEEHTPVLDIPVAPAAQRVHKPRVPTEPMGYPTAYSHKPPRSEGG